MKRILALLLALVLCLSLALTGCDNNKKPNTNEQPPVENTVTPPVADTGKNDENNDRNDDQNDDRDDDQDDDRDDDRNDDETPPSAEQINAAKKQLILDLFNTKTDALRKESITLGELLAVLFASDPSEDENADFTDFDDQPLSDLPEEAPSAPELSDLCGEILLSPKGSDEGAIILALKGGMLYTNLMEADLYLTLQNMTILAFGTDSANYSVSYVDLMPFIENLLDALGPMMPVYALEEDMPLDGEELPLGEQETPALDLAAILQFLNATTLDLSGLPVMTADMLTVENDGFISISENYFKTYITTILEAVATTLPETEAAVASAIKTLFAQSFGELNLKVALHCTTEKINGVRFSIAPSKKLLASLVMLASSATGNGSDLPGNFIELATTATAAFSFELLLDDDTSSLKTFLFKTDLNMPLENIPTLHVNIDFANGVLNACDVSAKLNSKLYYSETTTLCVTTLYEFSTKIDFNAFGKTGGTPIKQLQYKKSFPALHFENAEGKKIPNPSAFDPADFGLTETFLSVTSDTCAEENILSFSVIFSDATTSFEGTLTVDLAAAPHFRPMTEAEQALFDEYTATIGNILFNNQFILDAIPESTLPEAECMICYEIGSFSVYLYYFPFDLTGGPDAEIRVGKIDAEEYYKTSSIPLYRATFEADGNITFTLIPAPTVDTQE